MLKIVEVHPSSNPKGEYVVLHNLGLITERLRGCALCTDAYLDGSIKDVGASMYIFRQDIQIKPYMRVVVFTGCGDDGWVPTTDGKQAYCAYWGRAQSVWHSAENIHVLQLAATRRIAQPGTLAAPHPESAADQDTKRQANAEWEESYAVASRGETVR